MKNYIKKADIILLIFLIILGLVSSAYLFMSKSTGNTVIIEARGEVYGKYSLFEDKEIDVISTDSVYSDVHVCIKNGEAKVTKSGCKNQVCVRHSAIKNIGESIICLPNKVIVKIEGNGGGYDAISR